MARPRKALPSSDPFVDLERKTEILEREMDTQRAAMERLQQISKVRAEPLRDPSFTHIYPEDHDRVMSAIDSAIASHGEYSIEYRIVRADGEVRWLQDRGRIVCDDNCARYATGAVMDVTARRQLADHERALSDARAQLIRD